METENTESIFQFKCLDSEMYSPLETDHTLVLSEPEDCTNTPSKAPPADSPDQDAAGEKYFSSSDSSPSMSGSPQLDKLICELEEMKVILNCEEPVCDSTNEADTYDSDQVGYESLTSDYKSQRPSTPFLDNPEETNLTTTAATDLDDCILTADLECPLIISYGEGDVSELTLDPGPSRETHFPTIINENPHGSGETFYLEPSSTAIFVGDCATDVQEESMCSFTDPVDIHTEESTLEEQDLKDKEIHSSKAATAEHFTFEEIMPDVSLFEKTIFGNVYSEDSVDAADSPAEPKAQALSTSDDGNNSPPVQQNLVPPEYSEVVQCIAESSALASHDPELFFDCIHEASWTESEDAEKSVEKTELSHKKGKRAAVLSSGSEDYEDASFSHGEQKQWEDSDEEFIMCEAAVAKMGDCDDSSESLAREVNAELGPMSESSDDEFLTTRIVRRRVVIKSDEMPDLSTPLVTEEKYTDENGHTVVKRVTRKVIRKCVSTGDADQGDGLAGAAKMSINVRKGDGYSRVVKRTVLKSEGDHTEVTFAGSEGLSAATQATVGGYKVSQTERTTVVKGERTMTQHGDSALSSDLPSARDDFEKALSYLSGFTKAELPPVVERESVKEDGTVVRRAHMRKGSKLSRTVVKGSRQRDPVRADFLGNGSNPRELQQHLHLLFHHYYEKETDSSEEEEDE